MSSSPTIILTRPRGLTSLTLLLLSLAACDLQKIGNQVTARTVAVSSLLSTPPVEVSAAAIAGNGLDASIPALDAGITVPVQNLAFVFFGQRQGDTLDLAPVGTPGAVAKIKEVGGASFSLVDQGGGNYALPADAGMTYKANATYQFEFNYQSKVYLAEVERVPTPERVAAFHPAAGFVELEPGAPFAFMRPDPPQGQERNLAFVSVFALSNDGSRGVPTFTNLPSTPLAFLKLVVTPGDWKQAGVSIPGTAFPSRDANYLVVLQSAKLGGPKSDNLFSGSAVLAGTADVAIVKTKR